MADHRLEAVIRAVCMSYGLCDCNDKHDCVVDKELASNILKAVDLSDHEAGIVRVPEIPTPSMMMAGLKTALRGDAPSITYKEMLKAGINSIRDDANGSNEP